MAGERSSTKLLSDRATEGLTQAPANLGVGEGTDEVLVGEEDAVAPELIKAPLLETVLERAGGWGGYQWRLWIGLSLFAEAINCMDMTFMVFGGAEPTRHCLGNETIRSGARNDDCTSSCPGGWSFSEDIVSVVTEMGLYCDKAEASEILVSLQMAGVLVGALLWGQVAEVAGRKWVLCGVYAGVLGTGLLAALAPTWELLAAALFLSGTFGGGFCCVNFVTVQEVVGSDKRLLVACLNGVPLGIVIFSVLTYSVPHWRHALLVVNGVGVFGLVSFLWLEESPRWLLQHNRRAEAEAAIRGIARANGCELGAAPLDLPPPQKARLRRKVYTYRHLFRTPVMAQHFFALAFSWFVVAVVSYGLTFNIKDVPGDRFVNALAMGATQAAAIYAIPLASRWWGRRRIHQASLSSTALCCGLVFVLEASGAAETTSGQLAVADLAILGASLIGPSFCMAYLYSAELFPTVVRNLATGLCSVAARSGGIIAPLLLLLRHTWTPAPFLVFGLLTLGNVAVAAAFLPETKGRPLIDELPAKQSLVSLPSFASIRKASRPAA